ncbi:MAG: hypothetical protein ABSG13_13955 [Bryobacteraceae bacterium]
MLNSELIHSHMETFAGYGNADAPHWFIDMEEGGNADGAFLLKRFNTWSTRGRLIFEDLRNYHLRTSQWPYVELCDLPELENRQIYRRLRIPTRIELLKGLIDKHRPAFAVIYGTSYRKYWEQPTVRHSSAMELSSKAEEGKLT